MKKQINKLDMYNSLREYFTAEEIVTEWCKQDKDGYHKDEILGDSLKKEFYEYIDEREYDHIYQIKLNLLMDALTKEEVEFIDRKGDKDWKGSQARQLYSENDLLISKSSFDEYIKKVNERIKLFEIALPQPDTTDLPQEEHITFKPSTLLHIISGLGKIITGKYSNEIACNINIEKHPKIDSQAKAHDFLLTEYGLEGFSKTTFQDVFRIANDVFEESLKAKRKQH